MSVWARINDLVTRAPGQALAGVIEAVRTAFRGNPELRRRVAFSIAMIALSAKMAKADGIVTPDEVRAFQEIFSVPRAEIRNVSRLYGMAQQDIAGYETYARQLAGLCGSGRTNCAMLEDILDGLFHIAKADGYVHEREVRFLHRVAEIFEINDEHFRSILARHARGGEDDPYSVLGISRDADFTEIRKVYRRLAAENHPDRLLARGVPEEFAAIANSRMAAINAAYAQLVRVQQPA